MPDEDINKTGEESNAENNEQDDGTDTAGGEEDQGLENSGEEGEDGDKPLTKKDLLDFRKGIEQQINNRFAGRRHDNKNLTRPYKSDSNKSGKEEGDPLNARLDKIEISNAKRDFGYTHQLSPKEVDIVFKFANNRPTLKTLEDPFVKGGIERLRAQANLRNNTPDGSGSSSFEVDGKKWEEMKPEERQKNFQNRQKAILAKKGK